MYKWALAGLLAAAVITIFLAGPLLGWVEQFGAIPALTVALTFRLVVLALVVWGIVHFLGRRRGGESQL